jgi:outer membrane protein TolC
MKFSCLIIGLAAAATLHAATTPEEIPIDSTFLASIRAEAVRHHPEVAAKAARARAAAHGIRAVRLWDDPMIGFSLKAAEQQMRRDEGDMRISFDQPLPRPKLTAAKRQQAREETLAKQEEIKVSANDLAAEAARSVIELALADETLALRSAQLRWVSAMIENARQKAATPGASSTDALRLETERLRDQQMLAADRRTRQSMAEQLNILLGRSITAAWPTLRLPAGTTPTPLASSEVARINRTNPEILGLVHMAEATGAATTVAEREAKPSFALSVESNIYSGGGFRDAMIGLKMNLPWFNHSAYQAGISQATEEHRAAVMEIEAARRSVKTRVIAAANEAANAAIQANAYSGDILTSATRANETTESAWMSSGATLLDVLESRRSLSEIRLEQRRFVAAHLAALETLSSLVPPTATLSSRHH